MNLWVLEPGIRSTVQDTPRRDHAREGLPGAGPADPVAYAAARQLAGGFGVVVEIVGLPFTFRCDDRRIVAVTGREVSLRSATRVPGWTATLARAGEEVTVLGAARFAYLAVSGGIDLPPVLGSRAAYLPARVGPLPRPLVAGDALPLGEWDGDLSRAGARLAEPSYQGAVGVIDGPHRARFGERALRSLHTEPFTVEDGSDRMGVRLAGPPLVGDGRELLSCAVLPGAIQVPRGGSPIVLGPDAQTTGGYPVIAVVARASLGRVAQARPGETLRFVAVEPARAVADLRALAPGFVA